MPLTWDDLPALFPGLDDPERWLPLLQRHADLLAAHEPAVKTTSVPPEDRVRRHFAESLELLRVAEEAGGGPPAIDVGSGGGFPGMVIAAARPAWQVHMVEPVRKRAALLETIATELGLANVAVHAERAEEAGRGPLRETGALVTARAVAALPVLLEYCVPLAAPRGLVALPKGQAAGEELADAAFAMTELGCELVSRVALRPEVSATPEVLLFRKTAPTLARYPRRPGLPSKRPLKK